MIKLCVGAGSVQKLRDWIAERRTAAQAVGKQPQTFHVTRMTPKRIPELLEGGSLYWVIKGQVSARQRLLAVESVTGEDGIERCRLVLDPELVETVPQPHRPFQGWRYLPAADAPQDIAALGEDLASLPESFRRELADLGLL